MDEKKLSKPEIQQALSAESENLKRDALRSEFRDSARAVCRKHGSDGE